MKKTLTYGERDFKFGTPVGGRGRSSFGQDPYDYYNPEVRGRETRPGWHSTPYGEQSQQTYGRNQRQLRDPNRPGREYEDMSHSAFHGQHHHEDYDAEDKRFDPYTGKRKLPLSEVTPKFDPFTGKRLSPPSPKPLFDPFTGKKLDASGLSPPRKKPVQDDYKLGTSSLRANDELDTRALLDDCTETDMADDAEFQALLHTSTPGKVAPRKTRSMKESGKSDHADAFDTFTMTEEREKREAEIVEERENEIKEAGAKIKKYKPFLTRRIKETDLITWKQAVAGVKRYITKGSPGPDSFFAAVAGDCAELALFDEAEAVSRLRRQLALYIANNEHFTCVSNLFLYIWIFLNSAMN